MSNDNSSSFTVTKRPMFNIHRVDDIAISPRGSKFITTYIKHKIVYSNCFASKMDVVDCDNPPSLFRSMFGGLVRSSLNQIDAQPESGMGTSKKSLKIVSRPKSYSSFFFRGAKSSNSQDCTLLADGYRVDETRILPRGTKRVVSYTLVRGNPVEMARYAVDANLPQVEKDHLRNLADQIGLWAAEKTLSSAGLINDDKCHSTKLDWTETTYKPKKNSSGSVVYERIDQISRPARESVLERKSTLTSLPKKGLSFNLTTRDDCITHFGSTYRPPSPAMPLAAAVHADNFEELDFSPGYSPSHLTFPVIGESKRSKPCSIS